MLSSSKVSGGHPGHGLSLYESQLLPQLALLSLPHSEPAEPIEPIEPRRRSASLGKRQSGLRLEDRLRPEYARVTE